MRDDSPVSLPEPGSLRTGAPPYRRGVTGILPITRTLFVAAIFVAASGIVLFGWHTVRVLAIAIAVALLVESVFNVLAQRDRSWSESQALLTGILLACTLPPMVNWQVVVTGTAVAVLLGQILPGGVGTYLWHPVALGRVAVQMLFHEQLTAAAWPVLAPSRFIWGNLALARVLPPLTQWGTQPLPPGTEAWLVNRPIDILRNPVSTTSPVPPAEALARLVADTLPPWPDTLTGGAGGAIGEACVIAVLVAGLLLTWRGFLRWSMVLTALGSAAVLAAILPVHIQPSPGTLQAYWLPGFAFHAGLPVGLVYVCYHLTAGEFPFVVALLAADPSTTPLTGRGHLVFGLLLGTATILLRVLVGIPIAAYWALLIANTCVPAIDRLTRRRVFGTR